MMAPVVVAVSGSIRTNGEFMTEPFSWPKNGINLEHYSRILFGSSSAQFWRSLKNSLLITAGVTIINITLASMLAFVFTRVKFPTRTLWFNILSIGLMFPLVVAILPIFINMRNLGLLNNIWGVVVSMAAFGLPSSVVILRGFFIAIPNELEEAAYIDGASTLGFFRYILIPMARPAIFAVATIQIIAAWNDFFLALVVLSGAPDKWPLTMGLQQFQAQYGTDWSAVMAYIVLLMIPAIIFYLFTQRYIVTGLTGGELKG
jgi:raffinose/stachyose/melibiose transport system permease protein